jgi:hypothetical protein
MKFLGEQICATREVNELICLQSHTPLSLCSLRSFVAMTSAILG